MSSIVDLHTHSDKSDGSDPPPELVRRAARARLSAVALTDHDTVAGIAQAQEEARRLNVELIPGVELSTSYEGTELHIIGLFINPHSRELKKILEVLVETRKTRNEQLADRLRELGIPIKKSELPSGNGTSVTRAHFAKLLIEKGYCSSVSDAYNRYLGFGAPAHVPRDKLSPQQAISVIHKAGGIAVLAHLNQIRLKDDSSLLAIIPDLKEMGLDGLEAYYPEYTQKQQEEYLEYADIFDLAVTGGSDYHGDNKDYELGLGTAGEPIGEEVLINLKKRMQSVL